MRTLATCLVLLLLTWACASQPLPNLPSVSAPELGLEGRFVPGNVLGKASLPQTFSWAASSVYTNFLGASSVSITLESIPSNGNFTYGVNWFRFFIDGEFVADGFTSYKQLGLKMTLSVSSSSHQLRIAKVNDGSKGEAILQSITLDGGGKFMPLAVPSNLASNKRILFFGDSFTLGYGNLGSDSSNLCNPTVADLNPTWRGLCSNLGISNDSDCAGYWQGINANSLAAYGPLAATAMDADFQMLAKSGSGMVGYSYALASSPGLPADLVKGWTPSSQDLFLRALQANASLLYNLSGWQPQVVVIAGGVNDWKSTPPEFSMDAWRAQAIAFLKELSSTLGQPTIILLEWPEDVGLNGATYAQLPNSFSAQYIEAMNDLYAEALAEKIPNVEFMHVNNTAYEDYQQWCIQHPSLQAHGRIAAQLVDLIAEVVPGWSNPKPIAMLTSQSGPDPSMSLYGCNGCAQPLQSPLASPVAPPGNIATAG